MLRAIELQIHRDMKKVNEIRVAALQKGPDAVKEFKATTKKLKSDYKEYIN